MTYSKRQATMNKRVTIALLKSITDERQRMLRAENERMKNLLGRVR